MGRTRQTAGTSEPGASARLVSVVLRSAALGSAAGSRSSLGLAAPILWSPAGPSRRRKVWRAPRPGGQLPAALTGRGARVVGAMAISGELVADKLPITPSRLQPGSLLVRLASGGGGAALLARRRGSSPLLPVLAGIAGAAAGSVAGSRWRAWAARRRPDWQGAVIEDACALALASGAVSRVPASGR